MIDEAKLRLLKIELKEQQITTPTWEDVSRILNVRYAQAYNYLRVLREVEDG